MPIYLVYIKLFLYICVLRAKIVSFAIIFFRIILDFSYEDCSTGES